MSEINWTVGPDEIDVVVVFDYYHGIEGFEEAEVEILEVRKLNGEAVEEDLFDDVVAEFENGTSNLTVELYDKGREEFLGSYTDWKMDQREDK